MLASLLLLASLLSLASLQLLSSLLFLVFLLLLTFLLLRAAQSWLLAVAGLAVAGTYAGIPTVSCFILLVGIPAVMIM
jgi:hypothetical protein